MTRQAASRDFARFRPAGEKREGCETLERRCENDFMKLSLLISMMFVIGCGDNLGPNGSGGNDGGGGEGDAGPDASTIECDPPAAGAPGSACTAPEDCDSEEGAMDGRCLNADQRDVNWPETGYCVRKCDDGATDCGEGTTCFAQEGAAQVLCMPLCCEGVACVAGFACSTTFLGEDIGAAVCMPGDQSAADGTPCASVAECDVDSNCEPDQSGTSGVCSTIGCTVDDDATCAPGGDGTCVAGDTVEDAPHCVDPCEETADCATDDGQRCDEDGMFCRHSEIGDPCADAAECGQDPWLCKTEDPDGWPGGYCSIPCTDGCPTGTICNRSLLTGGDPFCVETCDALLEACDRPDYVCQDVNDVQGGLQLGCAPDPDL